MKKTCLILIAFFSSFALADGMPVPDPSVYFDLSEDHQIAIITIQEDLKASVDLFVSISDHSGESHQIQFILPFYESPESFKVVEKNLSDIEKEKTNLWMSLLKNSKIGTQDLGVGWFKQRCFHYPL